MTLVQRPAPHVRHTDSITVSMADVLLSLLPCLAMGVYYGGLRLLVNSGVAVLTALLAETAVSLPMKRQITVGDLSAVVTGLIISLLLPVNIACRYVVLASLTAVLVAKWMFGGVGKNIFNPALVGVVLVTLVNTDAATATGNLTLLKQSEPVSSSFLDVFIGRAGEIPAAVCLPVILVVGLYLTYRRIVSPQITLSLLATVAVLALLFPRGEGKVWMELMSGSLLFCSVFCANDPVTTPNTAGGKVLFGIFTGVVTMLIRWYGRFDEGVLFAIVMMNAVSFALDKAIRKLRIRRKGGDKVADGNI